MKRVLSYLLVLIMVVGMVPGVAAETLLIAPAPAKEPISAYYFGQPLLVDGKLDEAAWVMRDKIGGTKVTALCNGENLYFGLQTEEAAADLTFNGVQAEVDFVTGSVSVNGEKVGAAVVNGDRGTAEVQVPLDAVGLSYTKGQSVAFSAEIGADSYTGTLVLAPAAAVYGESFDAPSTRFYGKKLGGTAKESYMIADEEGQGAIHYLTGAAMTANGMQANEVRWQLGSEYDQAIGFEMSFTVDFNDLTIPGQPAYLALCGYFIEVRADVYVRMGFFADEAGNIYVSQYENTADLTKKFDTGYDLPAKNLFVQITANDEFETEVKINGKTVAEFAASSRRDTKNKVFGIGVSTSRRANDQRKNDVLVYDLLMTQAAPNASLSVSQVANSADLKLDGSADEVFWTMKEIAPGTKLGTLCDEQNLYLALDTKESTVNFKFNGMNSTAKLGKNPSFALGYTMGSTMKGNGAGQYEIAIPLNLLHVDEPTGQNIDFSVTAGGKTREYNMTVGGGAKLALVDRKPAAGDGKQDTVAYLDVAGLIFDGKLKENQWYTPYQAAGSGSAPAAGVGFLWNGKNLYVGGQVFSAARAETLQLTFAGKTVTADLMAKTASGGEVAAAGQTFEWRIPLSDFGFANGLNVQTDYKLEITNAGGTSVLYGKMDLQGKSVVYADTCDDFNTKNYTVTSTTKYTTQNQGDGIYEIRTDDALGSGNELLSYYTLLDFEGGAYEFTIDMNLKNVGAYNATLGWRGMCWEIRQPELQTRYNFRDDGDGNILMDILYHMHVETANTGVKLGERATFTMKVDDDQMPTLYVNGQFVKGFSRLNRTEFTINDTIPMPRLIVQPQNYSRIPNNEGELGKVEVDLYDLLWTQSTFVDAQTVADTAIGRIYESNLLNGANAEDVTKLTLPREITAGEVGVTLPITWKAVDAITGQTFTNLNLDTGVVTRGTKPAVFNLIASVEYNGKGASKSFSFATKGQNAAGKVALIVDDADSRIGAATNFTLDSYEYFDYSHNSLVYDQGSSKQFNTIKLYDSDEYSRVSVRHLGVFVSDDNVTYRKVTGWLLHQNGKEYTIYNLSEKARYVKVRNYHDDLDITGEVPSFYNAIQSMMTVSNEANLPGAGGAFAHKAEVKVTTGEKDSPVFISIASLGAKAGQYKADASDFRFTVGDTVLAHWYNGKDGFYVRMPAVPATVTAQWGCSSAKDFSDPEAVFEVAYGNVALIHISKETYDTKAGDGLLSHGRPYTFSNGDIIVVGRGIKTTGDTVFVRSTDGGRTFNKTPEVIMRDAGTGRSMGFGGFMYNPHIDRTYVWTYSGKIGAAATDYRLLYFYTDDCGKTWSEPQYITSGTHMNDPVLDTDIFLQNNDERMGRTIFYGDGLTLSTYDGDGPNVDYVMSTGDQIFENGVAKSNVAYAIYSKDGGKSWIKSDTLLEMNGLGGGEYGLSETSLSELSNGDLYLVSRAQQKDNFYLWEATSKDQGKTWTQGYSKIISSNTSPVLARYGEDRLILHSSRNSLGGDKYRRTPMHLGVSSDDYQSFDHYVDLTFATSFDTLQERYSRMTQPGIAFSKDGNEAFVCYFDHNYVDEWYNSYFDDNKNTVGFLIEEFDEMVYGSKSGYDDFEDASLKYQGWLADTDGKIELSKEASVSGKQSMKVVDGNAAAPTHAARQIPAMKKGTVGAKVLVPAGNQSEFVLELKAAFNFTYLRHSLATVAFAPDGTISVCYEDGKQAVAKVEPGTWNDVAISFDIAEDMGKLTVNGEVVSDIRLKTSQVMTPSMSNVLTADPTKVDRQEYLHEDVIQEITSIQFSQIETTPEMGDCLYVDDFYAIELTEALNRSLDNIDFADVTKSDWYYDAVSFAVENGIMSGYNAEKFGPNDTLNRAMVVQVLYNKEGQPALNGLKHNFSDVPASQWFNNAVTWGSNRGVVSGFGGGIFKPEDAVTIEQVAVILCNYSGAPTGYGDISKVGNHSDWAANALKWAVEKGLLDNVPFTNATEKATRAQTAQMLTNYLRNS